MQKLVIDARMINHSGIGTYIKGMIPGLINDFEISLLGNPELLIKFDWLNKVELISTYSSIYSIQEQIEFFNKIPECDIFLSPHYNIPISPIKAKKRVVIVHDVNHLAFIKNLPLAQKFYAKVMMNSAIKFSDRIITVSEFSKNELIKYTSVDPGKIEVVYFGIDSQKLSKEINNLNEIKLKYGLPDKYFLFVGSAKPHKNLINTLTAFEKLLEKTSEYKLVIVGDKKSYLERWNELTSKIKNKETLNKEIYFTDYVEETDLTAIYKLSFCLLFLSYYEGFGIPPLEAMAAGIPVIAAREASIPEVCGDAAIYANAFNPDEISNKMFSLIQNPELQNDLVKNGFENLKRFSQENFQELLKTILNNL